jgi:hypothetical protein
MNGWSDLWANRKIDKKSLTLLKQIVNIPKEDMEDYHYAMFTYAMELFLNMQV